MRRLLLLCAVGALTGCASAEGSGEASFIDMMGGSSASEATRIAARLQGKPLGSADNPIRTYMPEGQRAYLARLRCADGKTPGIFPRGQGGIGAYGSLVDLFAVDCGAASPGRVEIAMDGYQEEHQETRAPDGFTIAAR